MPTLSVPSIARAHGVLRQVAVPAAVGTSTIVTLAAQMCDTVRQFRAAGLAAPQVGHSVRLIVLAQGRQVIALCNPRITARSGMQRSVEGCLSLPGVRVTVQRAARVTVVGERPEGGTVELTLNGREAAAAQHEVDHLEGVLILDHAPVGMRAMLARRAGIAHAA